MSEFPDAAAGPADSPDRQGRCATLAAVNAFKPHLATVADYPYSKVDARVKLDQNESPEDFPADLKARALDRLAVLPWNRYPELHAEEVRAAIARHEGWPEEGSSSSPGSNLLVLALAQGARSVIDTVPAFPYYKGGAAAAGTPYRSIRSARASLCRRRAPRRDRGAAGRALPPNPHAPTGRLFEAGDVERLAVRARERDWLLVVDEAYHAFAGTDARPLARGNPNVAVLRTFSKSWCLGGIRAGYLLAAPRVAAMVRALVPPFCIPAHTGAILLTALEAPDRFAPIHERIRRRARAPLRRPRLTP